MTSAPTTPPAIVPEDFDEWDLLELPACVCAVGVVAWAEVDTSNESTYLILVLFSYVNSITSASSTCGPWPS